MEPPAFNIPVVVITVDILIQIHFVREADLATEGLHYGKTRTVP